MAAFNLKSMKNFAGDAGAVFSRAVQYTKEKMGTAERTEFDGHFDSLADRADKTKMWTEKLVSNTEAVLEPNPSNRVEDYLFEKIDRKRGPERMRNLEWLGADMIGAGIEFGPGTVYGSALIQVGQTQQKLGETERDFVTSSFEGFVCPLSKFLNEDMRAITRERKILEDKRLDLDAAKNRLKKAKTAQAQMTSFTTTSSRKKLQAKPERIEEEIEQAEKEITDAQVEFDRQTEVTRVLLEGMGSAHNQHVQHLARFVEAQSQYYARCQEIMKELQKELSSLPLSSGSSPFYIKPVDFVTGDNGEYSSTNFVSKNSNDATKDFTARVLHDYVAKDESELSVSAGEMISARRLESDAEYVMGQTREQRGKLPLAYLEIIN